MLTNPNQPIDPSTQPEPPEEGDFQRERTKAKPILVVATDPISSAQVDLELERAREGESRRFRLRFDTEDIIAIFAGVVAIIIAIGMLAGLIPVNIYTLGVFGFSSVGGVIAKIIGTRNKALKSS